MTTIYKFKAYYTDAGVGTAQDPAPTCTVINMADDSKLADAQATTASTNMPGLYSYEYSGADGLDCVAWFKTTDTGCDVKELASYVSEKITTNLNADVAGVETKLDTVDSNVDAILADTGTDGVVLKAAGLADDAVTAIQSGLATPTNITAGTLTTVGTATNLTNLPTMPTDWVTAAGLKADAVAEIADGVWIHDIGPYGTGEAGGDLLGRLVNIADWLNEAGRIDLLIDAIKAKTDNLPASPANEATLTAIKGATWTNQTLEKIVSDIAAISAGGATAQEVWEYATRVLTAGTNIDLSSLATAANLAATDAKIDAVLEDTGTTLPASLTTLAGCADGIAGDVWSHSTRTLTNQGVTVTTPATGDPLEIYRDTTVVISLTGLGTTTGYTKIWFTIKEDLEDLDTAAVLQITTADGLKYIDGETGAGTDGTLVIDNDLHTATITLLQASSASLPVYAAYPIPWDLKMLSNSVVSILAEGTIYIKSTPTRTIS